jgi:hypothetical protein
MRSARTVAVVVLGIAGSSVAHANAGVPMLALAWPFQWLALVPIVVIESFVLARALSTTYRGVVWQVVKANFLSTLVGVPVAWAAMLLLEFAVGAGAMAALPEHVSNLPAVQVALFPFMAAWVGGSSPWEVYAAFVVLTVPFFATSVYVERHILQSQFPAEQRPQLFEGVRLGNVITYALLVLGALYFPVTA